VVWVSNMQDGSSYGVFGQRYASTGAPLGPEFRVNTYTTSIQDAPSVAKDPDPGGNFLVVWRTLQDGSGDGVFGQRYSGSGFPLGAEFRVNSHTPNSQSRPAIAANVTGGFVVVWHSDAQDGSGYGIFGQRYSGSGAPLGPEFRVNTYTTSAQSQPSVAADLLGNFVVVWVSFHDGSSSGVFGQRYASSGAPLGSEFRVNTYTTTQQVFPAVASDSSGNFVVTWHSDQPDDPDHGVFGQRYASSGAPLGPEFRVNSYTTGAQFRPSVASDSSGNLVVVWDSNAQDGSLSGVFGQRYGQIVPVELLRFGVE
jgi:large repetitive protein